MGDACLLQEDVLWRFLGTSTDVVLLVCSLEMLGCHGWCSRNILAFPGVIFTFSREMLSFSREEPECSWERLCDLGRWLGPPRKIGWWTGEIVGCSRQMPVCCMKKPRYPRDLLLAWVTMGFACVPNGGVVVNQGNAFFLHGESWVHLLVSPRFSYSTQVSPSCSLLGSPTNISWEPPAPF